MDHIEYLTSLGLFNTKGNINSNIRKNIDKFNIISNYIKRHTNFLPEAAQLPERVYCIKHNIINTARCVACNVPLQYTADGYRTYCSVMCSNNSEQHKIKSQKTNMDKLGVAHPAQSMHIQNKIKQTNLLRWGVEYPMQSSIVRDNHKTSTFNNIGVEYPMQSSIVRDSHKLTMLINHGVESPHQSPPIRSKYKQTMLLRHGAEYTAQSISLANQMRQTCIYRYGVEYKKQINMYNSGALEKLLNSDYLYEAHHELKKPVTEIAHELNVNHQTIRTYLNMHNIQINRYYGSYAQKAICQYIAELYVGALVSNKRLINNTEIDILLPDLNIGIEYNGVYWHSELVGRLEDYHITKTNLCKSNNIKLIQIWSNEWIYKQDIVKSRICTILQLNKKIYARCCIATDITELQAIQFFNATNIQGSKPATNYIGLLHNNELIATMSFNTIDIHKLHNVELLQFSCKLNTTVVGGASKLLSYYIKKYNPSQIVSYSDNRWEISAMYQQLGFILITTLNPTPHYFNSNNCNKLFTVDEFKSHITVNINLSDLENMKINGYNRIWDCGSNKWELII